MDDPQLRALPAHGVGPGGALTDRRCGAAAGGGADPVAAESDAVPGRAGGGRVWAGEGGQGVCGDSEAVVEGTGGGVVGLGHDGGVGGGEGGGGGGGEVGVLRVRCVEVGRRLLWLAGCIIRVFGIITYFIANKAIRKASMQRASHSPRPGKYLNPVIPSSTPSEAGFPGILKT